MTARVRSISGPRVSRRKAPGRFPGRGFGRIRTVLALAGSLALLVLASGSAFGSPTSAAGTKTWQIAPAGPCARLDTQPVCSAGQCTGEAAVRSRFDPADVAGIGPGSGSGAAPPEPIAFQGPGPCADPSTPCGKTLLGRSPSGLPTVGPPPTGVIEQPATPGTLPGGLPGLP